MCNRLAPCGRRPNCVCSGAGTSARQHVEPFTVSDDPAAAFLRLKDVLSEMPRTTLLTATEEYLHAVCRTRLGFADDLECQLSRSSGVIHVRSASRLGYYDFGANRARVEMLRQALRHP